MTVSHRAGSWRSLQAVSHLARNLRGTYWNEEWGIFWIWEKGVKCQMWHKWAAKYSINHSCLKLVMRKICFTDVSALKLSKQWHKQICNLRILYLTWNNEAGRNSQTKRLFSSNLDTPKDFRLVFPITRSGFTSNPGMWFLNRFLAKAI